ncbi:hypothetical protein B0T25DRAFT_619858 [Lasiosphaeria hispida]|uniref:Diphthine--ammonia ligase n=1 Tax=Lasiosphaeria hispida TaxID=260671 RepID=A0AAJ0HU62_9PEZI|nr:hypothetical protein B0T25DRAFT_619858 [Lasiosphaeria hispida]
MTRETVTMASGLNVIALVSGGKDSFFSLLHCRANGHHVVALANLHPAVLSPKAPGSSSAVATIAIPAPASSAASAAVSAPVQASGVAIGPSFQLPQPRATAGAHGQAKDENQGVWFQTSAPESRRPSGAIGNEVVGREDEDEQDLNSFMYQTVGHQVIPLYADATGIPLYRRAITGSAAHHGKDYSHQVHSPVASENCAGRAEGSGPGGRRKESEEAAASENTQEGGDTDETESMIPLLRAIKAAHPETNAICAGAILSTYQRTRVESVATRLGLVPLAYLWKFPILPAPKLPLSSNPAAPSGAQLLDDMAAVGLEARLIKVASGGLDDSFLWTNIASVSGRDKVMKAMRRFGIAETGAVIGEGGEFETLVLDGPPSLFRKRIIVEEEERQLVREGGGSSWLSFCGARLEAKEKAVEDQTNGVRIPDLLDARFIGVLDTLRATEEDLIIEASPSGEKSPSQQGRVENDILRLGHPQENANAKLQQWCFTGDAVGRCVSIEAETTSVIAQIRQRLQLAKLPPSAIISTTILLRRMADFPITNTIYGSLFDAPNPPSRVTVSCGSLLSQGNSKNIAVYLTVHTALPASQRQGLHVQSRSYWAPANIGPYSQAITIPVASLASSPEAANREGDGGPKLVSIAGQIPLVPATMTLPEGGLELQLTLSLQHLWRIGLEMGVQWWSSAVAYFPGRASDDDDESLKRKAILAAKSWEEGHVWGIRGDGESDDEDEEGPDLWDRNFNPEFMSVGTQSEAALLPDWGVVVGGDSKKSKGSVPPVFIAEVAELPRAAGVEWHVHTGFANAAAASVTVWYQRADQEVYQTLLKSGSGVSFVQTIVAETLSPSSRETARKAASAFDRLDSLASASITRLSEGGTAERKAAIAARYIDASVYSAPGTDDGESRGAQGVGPVVPCASLWDGKGRRLASVTVYQSVFEGGVEDVDET